MNIVIYSKSNCPNCTTAKRLLDGKGLGYEEYNTDYPATKAKMLEWYPDARQMPFIIINGQRVGGLAGLQAALKQVGL